MKISYLISFVLLGLSMLLLGCQNQQSIKPTPLPWKEQVLQAQQQAFAIDPQLRLDAIRASSSPDSIDDPYQLTTVVDFVNHDTHAFYDMAFNETEVVRDLEFSGSSNINQVNAYKLLNNIQILPSELISITQAELDSYRSLTTPAIDVTFWLRTSTSVPEQFKPEHILVWQVRYHGRHSDNAFLVWVDAETGAVLGSEFQDYSNEK